MKEEYVTNFQYIHPNQWEVMDNKKLKNLCLTIATKVVPMNDGRRNTVIWSVALKNPKDKFDKKIAREAAEINGMDITLSGQIYFDAKFSRNDIITKILSNLYYEEYELPTTYKYYVRYLLSQYYWKLKVE